MKIFWQDTVIAIVLLFFISLPIWGGNQIYSNVLNGNHSFAEDIKDKRLFYPMLGDKDIPLNIEADAYFSVLIDPDQKDSNKTLLKKNDDSALPMASITKLMTAVVAIDNYKLDDEILIDESDLRVDGNMASLKPGQVFKVKDLLYFMLIDSNNGAAEAFARKMGRDSFVKKMNQKAAFLKMNKTSYLNPSGLDIDGVERTNMTSSEDLTRLVIEIMNRYPLIGEMLGNPEYTIYDKGGSSHQLTNTNLMLSDDDNILWGKTGFTLKAKGCLVLVSKPRNFSFSQKRYIIITVLGAEDRFETMRRIRSWQDNQFIW
ncbi:MAG: serine hydrolase [Candidatus Pacebacteria bacterium]|nr:serine hydrolase [Candidatus Paceibacterota bacterium]